MHFKQQQGEAQMRATGHVLTCIHVWSDAIRFRCHGSEITRPKKQYVLATTYRMPIVACCCVCCVFHVACCVCDVVCLVCVVVQRTMRSDVHVWLLIVANKRRTRMQVSKRQHS